MLSPAVAVFLDAPRLGEVRPALAAAVGERQALRLYRVIAARTLAAVVEAGWQATVWFGPAEAASEMRHWLGASWEFRPQASGDPGARLAAAYHAVEVGRVWLALDALCPAISARVLRDADAAIAYGGLVVGPTHSGAVHLIGGLAPLPDLWHGLPWGTPELSGALRARLAERGLPWRELPPMHGSDTALELKAAGLLT